MKQSYITYLLLLPKNFTEEQQNRLKDWLESQCVIDIDWDVAGEGDFENIEPGTRFFNVGVDLIDYPKGVKELMKLIGSFEL